MNPMNVFLIGYRATGKTTVAKYLANMLGWNAIDADDEIESRAGKSIAEIFANQGEPAFRDLETLVVSELANREKTIISLGGGAIDRAVNRASIENRGVVVWLTAKPETICQRMKNDESTSQRRPNLTASAPETEVREILTRREPIYRECADLVVDTENREPQQIAKIIIDQLSLTSDKTDTT